MNRAKNELNKFKKDEERLNSKKLEIEAKLNLDDSDYKRKVEEIERKKTKEIKINTNSSGIIDSSKEIKINNKYDNQLANLGLSMEKNIDKANYELEKIESSLERNKKKQEEWNSKISKMNDSLAKTDLKGLDSNIDNINKSITNTVKKVGKWTLALFGVRSAYSAIRNAASTLSQYNKQIGVDLDYIRFAVASVFQPLIEKIVGIVFKLLSYVNYLAKAWFNVDLFARASTKNFNKANASAKKLKKTLGQFNFDEINKLEDNSSSDGGGISTPSMDLSKSLEEPKIPTWLEKLKNFFQPVVNLLKNIYKEKGVIGVITSIALAFAGWEILKSVAKWITGLGSSSKGISADFTGLLDGLGKAAETFALLGGLSLVIQGVCNLIDTFSKSGLSLGETAGLLGIVLGELVGTFILLLGVMTLLQPSWQSIAGATVIFLGLAAVIESTTHLIDSFSKSGLSLNDVITLMSTIMIAIIALMGSIALLGPAMTAGLVPFVVVIAAICATLITMALTLPIILDAVGKFINNIAPTLIQLIVTINNCINNTIYALGTVLPPIINSVGNLFTSIFNGVAHVIETVGNTIVRIMNTAKNLTTVVLSAILGFINNLGPAINRFVDGVISAVTRLINFLISGIEYMVNTLIIGAVNKLIAKVNNIPLVDVPKLGKVSIERFKPRFMATGGIIDVPKRGVPLANNVVGGEAGAEGVLPLTNEDTMARLGKEIGKWITLNIDLTSKIDMRILCRELIRYMQENEFSRNGG